MSPALTLRALSFALMTFTVFAWAHEPGGEEHSEAILAHLRHRLDSNDPPLDLEGSVWRIRADFRGYYDSTNTEIISLWFQDWDYTEEHGWNIDLGGDHEWLIIPSSPPSLPVMMHAYAGYNYGLTEATHFPHLYMGNIMNVYEVEPYVIPLSGETRAPGYATLTGWIHNYNDEGEYDDIWVPGPEPGQGHWDENPLHADSSINRSMTIAYCSLTGDTYIPKGLDLVVQPTPEPWPDAYSWQFWELSEDPPPGTDTMVSSSWYETRMDSQTPPLRGDVVTVTAEGDIIGSLVGGQQLPTGYRFQDTMEITIFSVNIEPALWTTQLEEVHPPDPPDSKWLWYIGLPPYVRARIHPASIDNDFIDDVTWLEIPPDLNPITGIIPSNRYRRRIWWSPTQGNIQTLLTIEGHTDAETQVVDVADWFYHPNHGSIEVGLQNFTIAPIGAMASWIISGSMWNTGLVKTTQFAPDLDAVLLPSVQRPTRAWVALVRDNLSNATTHLDKTFWSGPEGIPVYFDVPDAILEDLSEHLTPWGGHHPPGGGTLATRQLSIAAGGPHKAVSQNCTGSCLHALGAGPFRTGTMEGEWVATALNTFYDEKWTWNSVAYSALATHQFQEGDVVVWPGRHTQIVAGVPGDNLLGTDTVMIAANNQRVEIIGLYEPVSLEAYRQGHSIPLDTEVHLVFQEEGP